MNRFAAVEASLDLKFLNRCLLYACAAALILVPLRILGGSGDAERHGSGPAEAQRESAAETETQEPLSSYVKRFEDNPVFGTSAVEAALPALQSSIAELTKNYSLKGVMLMGEPEAIVEDNAAQKTLFLKAGDSLGELKVKSIEEGRIVVAYLGEERSLQIE